MQAPEIAYAKAIEHSASMVQATLEQAAVPLLIIAARPEDESMILVAFPGASDGTVAHLLEEALRAARTKLRDCELN
jgi:hypothetical protein